MTKRKPVTAAELMAQLESDPEWVAQRDAEEEQFRQRELELRRAENPLLEDLKRVGVGVSSVWDLAPSNRLGVVPKADHPEALPVLLEHLAKPYPDAVKAGLVRALGVAEAAFAWSAIVATFRDLSLGNRTREGAAVALSSTTREEQLDELIELIEDKTLGPDRLLLLEALYRMRSPRAIQALEDAVSDSELTLEAQDLIKRLR